MTAWLMFFMLVSAPSEPLVVSMPWSLSFEKDMPAAVSSMERKYLDVLGKTVRLQPPDSIRNFLKRKENIPYRLCREDLVCWTDLMQKLKVDAIVRNEITRLGGQYFLYVQVYLKNSHGKLHAAGSFTVALKEGWLRQVEERITRLLVPWKFVGTLIIESDVKGARVVVDGALACTTPCKGLTLPAGVHAIRITHELYRDFIKFVNVGYNSSARVTANLTAYPKVTGRLRARAIKSGHTRKTVKPVAGTVGKKCPWYSTRWGIAALTAAAFAVSFTAGYLLAPDDVVYPPYNLHIDVK